MPDQASSCDNPLCTCTPCSCGEGCRCGTARLGDLEQRVMEELWTNPESALSAREVTDRLGEYALTTISTVLGRLATKGIVRRCQEGRFVVFQAVETEAEHTATLMREALATTGEPSEAIAQFVRSASPDERRALRTALAEATAGRP